MKKISIIACLFLSVSGISNNEYQNKLIEKIKNNPTGYYSPELHRQNFDSIDFSNAELTEVNLSCFAAKKIIFTGANLTDATIAGLEADEVDFSNANLKNVKFDNVRVKKFIFKNTNCQNATFKGVNLANVHFDGTNITNATFRFLDLGSAKFTNVKGSSAMFDYVNLAGAHFEGGGLSGAKFEGIKFDSKTDQEDKKLTFKNVNLTDTDFTNVDEGNLEIIALKRTDSSRGSLRRKDSSKGSLSKTAGNSLRRAISSQNLLKTREESKDSIDSSKKSQTLTAKGKFLSTRNKTKQRAKVSDIDFTNSPSSSSSPGSDTTTSDENEKIAVETLSAISFADLEAADNKLHEITPTEKSKKKTR